MQYFPKNKNNEIMILNSPFASKYTIQGKLFREKFGFVHSLLQGTSELVVENPFDVARINKAEFKWFPEGVTVEMIILDSSTGIYQQSLGSQNPVPNAPLTQHGHSCGIAKDRDEDVSEYDATLLKGMKLKFVFNNPGEQKNICVNVVFHKEVIS